MQAFRNTVISFLSLLYYFKKNKPMVRFVLYHDVRPESIRSFVKQLEYMETEGSFISMEKAVELLKTDEKLDKIFFCLTFDDGYKDNYDNVFPILQKKNIPATIFLATWFIHENPEKKEQVKKFMPWKNFLSWDQCREMADTGLVTFGSHTVNHKNIAELNEEDVRDEMSISKLKIEQELGINCDHFSCPFGQPVLHYRPERDPVIANELGYKSFFTCVRGGNFPGDSLLALKRDSIDINSVLYHLRYFLKK